MSDSKDVYLLNPVNKTASIVSSQAGCSDSFIHTSVAMAHDKRELIPDSGLRPGSVKPAGRASSAMTKTLNAE